LPGRLPAPSAQRIPHRVRGLTSDSLGSLRSSLTSLSGQLGGSVLSDTGIASPLDRLPCRPPLDGGGALGLRPRSDCPFQLGLLRIRGCAQAVGKTSVLGPVHLNLVRSSESGNATMGARTANL